MKIYELRYADDPGGILDEPREEQEEQIREWVMSRSTLFTSFDRAQAAANELHEELHRECLTPELIDSAQLSDNVCDELEWEEFPELGTWEAKSEALGAYWVIREHQIAD